MRKIVMAYHWCRDAAGADRIVALALLLVFAGIVAAWIVPAALIVSTGQYFALIYAPFMSLALTTFLVIPPWFLLAPRLFVWDGQIEVSDDEVVLDLTRFANPAKYAAAAVNQRITWNGTPALLEVKGGGTFHGRYDPPTVSTQSYYRAMHKPDLLTYARGKQGSLERIQLGLLVLLGLGSLVVGLLAVAE